jgi:ferric-chelate reductase
VTKIQVCSSRITSCHLGQHVLLCLLRIVFGQFLRAAIVSVLISHNGDLVFFLRAYKGCTKKILQYATTKNDQDDPDIQFLALIDGPYGGSHSDFVAFYTLLLVAGSTGITFTLPILLDIVTRPPRNFRYARFYSSGS